MKDDSVFTSVMIVIVFLLVVVGACAADVAAVSDCSNRTGMGWYTCYRMLNK
jgi:hypothetical protein